MPWRRRLARIVAMVILLVQALLVVRAYSADVAVFGFQMFPESSEWRATIERELADGTRVDIAAEWPGGYRWSELVTSRGLATPSLRHHADAGARSTLHFLGHALEWVAANTPEDPETVRLVATVELWENGRGPRSVVLEAER